MFQKWISHFQVATSDGPEPDEYWMERLCALLLVEIARSDLTIDDEEVDTIKQALQASSQSIGVEELDDIISTAKRDAAAATSLHEQLRQINSNFSREQKLKLVEQMWRVAFADGDLDKYEEHMIRELCELLHVNHQDFIQAKLKVTDA